MRKLSCLSLAGLLTAGIGWAAQATVIFTPGNNPQPGEENVLFGSQQTGIIITGATNQSGNSRTLNYHVRAFSHSLDPKQPFAEVAPKTGADCKIDILFRDIVRLAAGPRLLERWVEAPHPLLLATGALDDA
jgi:hypothetical protein